MWVSLRVRRKGPLSDSIRVFPKEAVVQISRNKKNEIVVVTIDGSNYQGYELEFFRDESIFEKSEEFTC